jgi:hypothetical protein
MLVPVGLMFALSLVGCGGSKKDETTVVTNEIEKEKGFTLALVAGATGASLSCTLSKGMKKDEDHVRWFNQTTGPVTIQFTSLTPFLETETSFVVPAGKFSPYYSLDTDKGKAGYDYTTTPALVSGGPTQPTISVGD